MNRSTRRAAVCLVLVAALSGCDEDALRPPPPASSARPATSAASTATTAAVEPVGNAAFSVVARSPDAFELYPLKGALFVDAAGFLAILGDGPLRQSPALMRGLEKGRSGRLFGAFPDFAWLVAGQDGYRWSGDRWVEEPFFLRPHERVLDLIGWGDRRAVAAVAMPGNDLRYISFATPSPEGEAKAPPPHGELPIPFLRPPAASRADPAAGEGEEATCKARMKADRVFLAALPSLELFAVGHTCEPGGRGGAIVERWPPGHEIGAVEALPEPESGNVPRLAGALARPPGEVIVYGSEGVPAAPYLARFDGKAWSLQTPPLGAGIDTLAAAEDGTLWAAAGGSIWKKAGAAAWEKVPLPPALAGYAAWPHGGDVWVSARQTEGKGRAVLLRTPREPRPELVRLPPRSAMAGSLAAHQRFFATSACDKVWAELATLGPSKDPATGKPAAIPRRFASLDPVLTGDFAALAPVVEDDGTLLHLGVTAPSRDLGRKLVAAYLEKNPGSTPAVYCHDPRPAGETPKPAKAVNKRP